MQIKVDFNAHRGIEYIFEKLPGKKCLLDVSSRFPKDIISCYHDHARSHDTVMFYNDDVWRYSDDADLLDFYTSFPNTQFYIQHLGHANRWLTDNCREFSIPFLIKADTVPRVPLKHQAQWGFANLNNRPSYARLLLGYHLWRANLISDMVYSQNNMGAGATEPLINGYTRHLLDQLPGIDDYFALLPIQWKDDRISVLPPNITQNYQFNTFRFYDHDAYDNAYCFITTETETEWWGHDRSYPTPIATEKTFKPFYSAQIGLWLVAQGHFAWLESHGLHTYQDLVGVDYDQKNTYEKIQTIVDIVGRGRQYIESYYHSHHRELLHNQEWMLTGQFESSILSAVEKFLF